MTIEERYTEHFPESHVAYGFRLTFDEPYTAGGFAVDLSAFVSAITFARIEFSDTQDDIRASVTYEGTTLRLSLHQQGEIEFEFTGDYRGDWCVRVGGVY
jgi:hypothetical protein